MPRLPLKLARQTMTNAYDFSFAKLNEPGDVNLADYAGKAVLIVNVASACGFTSQYRDLEALYEAKSDKGLMIVGVPCNDFGQQEPAPESEIREFCDTTYHVTFPMTAKVEITSRERRHPFYQWVADELGESALPRWNFHKILIGKDGALAASFGSKTAPLSPDMLEGIKDAICAGK
ncbi:MAG: glutathione peroxidase [Hyphomonadaceae bacterium]|nr:glutathione peroxidase [Hyphomonadaceae bacterium]MCA8886627.1 glutathione peroxidase [Hyphomonadaceae bacterium]